MKKFKPYKLILLAFLLFTIGNINAQTACDGTAFYEEQNGLLVIEMETGILSEQWVEASSHPNYTGDGYIYWSGNQFFGQTGNGVIDYPIIINTPGTYKFTWRMAVGMGTNVTDHNDSWLKINADEFYGEKGNGHRVKPVPDCQSDPGADCPMGSSTNGFMKVWGQSTNFIWASFTSDNDAHIIYATFDEPGEYLITINARSSWCYLDRMVLQLVGSVTDGVSMSLTTPPSNCTDGTTSTTGLEDKKSMKIYPNPSADFLHIEQTDANDGVLTIFDVQGKKVKEMRSTDTMTNMDVSGLSSGIYFIRFFDGKDFITRKVVKE